MVSSKSGSGSLSESGSGFKVSGFMVSWFQGFMVSSKSGSGSLSGSGSGFKVSGFKVSRFQGFIQIGVGIAIGTSTRDPRHSTRDDRQGRPRSGKSCQFQHISLSPGLHPPSFTFRGIRFALPKPSGVGPARPDRPDRHLLRCAQSGVAAGDVHRIRRSVPCAKTDKITLVPDTHTFPPVPGGSPSTTHCSANSGVLIAEAEKSM